MEEGEPKDDTNYAVLDVTKFKKYRTEMNEGAKVVRTEAGGYLSMSSSMTQRRLCHMQQLDFIKKCERPLCPRFLFPQLHNEAEMIGRVTFIRGENTQLLCRGMKIREDCSLFVCKLCLVRSQNPIMAR